ncbi:S10 family peptidase [Steroidobacter cummioxidans]|uniref:S10 family peptidase n=1 Tax=Steroidobacter cummioxidans TaxID=1803913 RepID=UPI000E310FDD|nr:carboxypeptidase [Steroidobacter cummioxidans]
MKRYGVTALAALIWLTAPVVSHAAAEPTPPAEQEKRDSKETDKQEKPKPESKLWTSRHQIRLGGRAIDYEATTGTLLMKNAQDEPIALFGFTAYVRQGQDARTRPIVFAYNGGPGSASAWLHMGILGPRRAVIEDLASNTRGPFKLVDNEYAFLDRADLVLIDPVGTGFSRPAGKAEGKQFWGVDNDIKSVSDFIVRYLGEYRRWASPKFVLGESYGGIRTGGVTYDLLTRHNVALNGIILVSPYLDFVGGTAGLNTDAGDANFLSTYAATAWYHKALNPQPPELLPFLREVEQWIDAVYHPILYKGARATPEERRAALEGLAKYTGVSASYWDAANLRVDENRFLQELMRAQGKTIGRIDSRFAGGMPNKLAEDTAFDPYASAVAPAIVATYNAYVRDELNVRSDQKYELSAGLYRDWDQTHVQPDTNGQKVPYANVLPDISYAMTMNPKMKVLVQSGYFDLACPYGTVNHAIDQLNITPELRRNVRLEYYEAGHMMYVHPGSMGKFSDDIKTFIDENAK